MRHWCCFHPLLLHTHAMIIAVVPTHLSQDLHAGGEVLSCRRVAKRVLANEGNHRVEGGHAHMLHRRRLPCLVQIHDGSASSKRGLKKKTSA